MCIGCESAETDLRRRANNWPVGRKQGRILCDRVLSIVHRPGATRGGVTGAKNKTTTNFHRLVRESPNILRHLDNLVPMLLKLQNGFDLLKIGLGTTNT